MDNAIDIGYRLGTTRKDTRLHRLMLGIFWLGKALQIGGNNAPLISILVVIAS